MDYRVACKKTSLRAEDPCNNGRGAQEGGRYVPGYVSFIEQKQTAYEQGYRGCLADRAGPVSREKMLVEIHLVAENFYKFSHPGLFEHTKGGGCSLGVHCEEGSRRLHPYGHGLRP